MHIVRASIIAIFLSACVTPPAAEKKVSQPWYFNIGSSDIFNIQLGRPLAELENPDIQHIAVDPCEFCPDSVIVQLDKSNKVLAGLTLRAHTDGTHTFSTWNNLKNHLDSLYGESRPASGYATWKTASDDGRLVEVELIDAHQLFASNEVIATWTLIEDRLYED